MRLAQLAYRVIRNNMQNPPEGLSFNAFVSGYHDQDPDYVSQISFAFEYIDRALQRLVTEKKTKPMVFKAAPNHIAFVPFDKGEVTAVVLPKRDGYESLNWHEAEGGIVVSPLVYAKGEDGKRTPALVCIEYRAAIPLFELEDIREEALDADGYPITKEREIDLEDYGVTDEMCAYVIEYAEAMLMENVSPDLSAKHLNYAETYFARLKTRYSGYPQTHVSKIGGIW